MTRDFETIRYEVGDRQGRHDHAEPARGAQRLRPPDVRGGARRLAAGEGRPRGQRRRAAGRGRPGLLRRPRHEEAATASPTTSGTTRTPASCSARSGRRCGSRWCARCRASAPPAPSTSSTRPTSSSARPTPRSSTRTSPTGWCRALEPVGLMRKVGLAETLRIALSGNDERVTAETALRIGLVTEVVDRDDALGPGPRDRRRHRRQAERRRPRARSGPSGSRSTGPTGPRWSRASSTPGVGNPIGQAEVADAARRPARAEAAMTAEPALGLAARIAEVLAIDPSAAGHRVRRAAGAPGASSADTVEQAAALVPSRAPRSASCCATGRRRSACCSACCGPAAAWSPSTPAAAPTAPASDIAGLDLAGARRRARRPRRRSCPPGAAATTAAADRPRRAARRSTTGTHDGGRRPARAWPCACSPAAPPARRSGSTSPTRPSSGCSSGAKHYERNRDADAAAAPGRRRRQLAARPPRRPVPGAAVRHRRPVVLRCSSGSPSTAGSTPCAGTARPPPASCPPRCAWCSRPTSTPPTSPASARWCRAPRRSTPTTPTPSSSEYGVPVLVSYAATEFGGGVAGWNLADHRALLGGQAGERRPGPRRLRAAGRRPGDRRRRSARRRGAARGEGRPARRRRGWVRTTDLARIDADGFLWILGRADQAIIRGGFKVLPDDVQAALERHPAVRGAAVVEPRRPPPRRGAGRRGRAARRRRHRRRRRPARPRRARCSPATSCPTEIRVVDALPRTDSGKVDLAAVARAVRPPASLTDGPALLRRRRGVPQGAAGLARRGRAGLRPAAAAGRLGRPAAPTTPAGSASCTTPATPG